MDLSLLSRFYTPKGLLQRVHFELLKMFFPGEKLKRKMDPYEFVMRLQVLVAANRKKPGTRQPAQRWQVKPHAKFSQIDHDKCQELLTEAGYVNAMFDLGDITHFDKVIVPGGRARSQWQRLTLLIWLCASGAITFDQLIFNVGRDLDDEVESVNDFKYIQGKKGLRPPKGCGRYREGYEVPTSLQRADVESQIMEHFWSNLDMPDDLAEIEPIYTPNPADLLSGDESLKVLVVTIQPHRFHLPKYTRLAPPGSTVVTVAPSALTGRHDNPYLCDGWGRDALETYRLVRANFPREIVLEY